MQLVAYLDVRHISIHAPRAGSDMGRHCVLRAITRFQSTLPVRGATISCRVVFCDRISISIHAPRAGSDVCSLSAYIVIKVISIHAPRAGSDHQILSCCPHKNISIHAPRAGSDQLSAVCSRTKLSFQSTLPVRGATYECAFLPQTNSHFNPRSPCGERLAACACAAPAVAFQSTLPVRGATLRWCKRAGGKQIFQSTLPVRGATRFRAAVDTAGIDFNPRSPCGERPKIVSSGPAAAIFQSTLPVRGATGTCTCSRQVPIFQSTLPVRGATSPLRPCKRMGKISIHAPRAGSDYTLPL